jgi:hypothetical protein
MAPYSEGSPSTPEAKKPAEIRLLVRKVNETKQIANQVITCISARVNSVRGGDAQTPPLGGVPVALSSLCLELADQQMPAESVTMRAALASWRRADGVAGLRGGCDFSQSAWFSFISSM